MGGKCETRQLASGFTGANLALTSTDAYVVDYGSGGRLLRISKADGTIRPIASGKVGGVAVFGGRLYWTLAPTYLGTDGRVFGANLDGSGVQELASGQATPQPIVADASGIYWLNYGTAPTNGAVMSVPAGATTPVVFADAQPRPVSLAVDGSNVYWFTFAGNDGSESGVYKKPKAGGTITPLAQSQPNATGSPFSIAVRGGRVYWAPRGLGNTDGRVRSIGIGGGAVTEYATNQVRPQAVDADDSFVYWTVYGNGNDGLVMKASLATREVTQVVGAVPNALGLALDGGTIYYTAAGNAQSPGGVFRIAR